MEINFKEIIQHQSDQIITFSPDDVVVIQTSNHHFDAIIRLTCNGTTFQMIRNPQFYKRLSVKEHIKFFIKWYDSPLRLADVLSQFNLLDQQHTRIESLSPELLQRVSFSQTILSRNQFVVAFNPFIESTNENIHLFHKLLIQLKHAGRSLMVFTSRIEDAFIVHPNVWTLKSSGLDPVITEATYHEENSTETIPSKLKVKVEDKTIFVNIEDIEYIESHDGKVIIMIEQETFVYDSTLSNAENTLKAHGFYRCHRSYVVNLHKVREIINWSKNTYSIVLDNFNQDKIPLSRTKYTQIQDLLVKL